MDDWKLKAKVSVRLERKRTKTFVLLFIPL